MGKKVDIWRVANSAPEPPRRTFGAFLSTARHGLSHGLGPKALGPILAQSCSYRPEPDICRRPRRDGGKAVPSISLGPSVAQLRGFEM